MTWRWLISSSASLWLAWSQAAGAADLKGQVELTNSKEPTVRRNKDYSGVVLWLLPTDPARAPAVPVKRAQMLQKNKTFTPHVVAIPTGGTVDFPNLDPFFHNAFSNFAGQQFDLPLYAPKTTKSWTFKRPGIVRVFCQIHSAMSAIIAVLPTPWYTVSPETGQFTISGVPPGEYQLKLFHERALPENLQFLEHTITVPEEGLTLPLISISETGFIPAPHLDKHGKPYPPKSGYGAGGGQ